MKNILLLALLVGFATIEVQPAAAQTSPSTMSKADMKKAKKARKQNGPEVYKGTVAEQRRIVTDAPGAEKENDNGDDTTTKKGKRKE